MANALNLGKGLCVSFVAVTAGLDKTEADTAADKLVCDGDASGPGADDAKVE
jgi:hypothetical protein